MLERTSNVIQIIFVEYLAMMLLASVVATLMARRGILGCPADPSYRLGLFQIVVGILGLVAFGWSVDRHPAAAGTAANGLPPADRERRQRQFAGSDR